tara:strand:+ start:107 stop:568 length:462 start_codon:yes stop_codon:yes gene_type:complete
MDLKFLAEIGTALSPYLVLGSIFYLALELRQQNKVSKAATRQEIAKAHQSLTLASMDERLISARIKFIKQEELSKEEEHVWTVHLHAIFRARENHYYQFKANMLDEEEWNAMLKGFITLFERPLNSEVWNRVKGTYSPTFVDIVEKELSNVKT